MGIRISLPEILAVGSCILFVTGSHIAGSVFLSLSILMGLMRLSSDMQEIKARQENFERMAQMIAGLGNYLGEFLKGIIFVAAQQNGSEEDDDTSNYN